jgi:hypothetical protein
MIKIPLKLIPTGMLIGLLFILPQRGLAQSTFTSNGAGLQQWNDPASWDVLGVPSLVVPGAADNVIIATGDPILVPAGSGSFSITNVTISSGVTLTNNSDNGTLTISGILTYTNNTSVLTNGTNASLSLTKNVSNLGTAGILNASAAGNTVTFGSSVTSIYAPGSNQFVNLTLSGASKKILAFDVTVTGNFLNGATSVYYALSGGVHKMTLGGNFTDNNNATANAYMKISLTGAIPIQNINRASGGTGYAYFFGFDVQAGAGTVLLNTPIAVGGSGSAGVTLQSGTLDVNAAQNNYILNYSGWSNTGGTFLPQKGTVQLCPYGPSAGAISVGKAGGIETFNNIIVTASSTGAMVKLSSDWSMSGSMQMSSGASAPTLNQQTFNITINGNWLNQGSNYTFTPGSGATVNFAGGPYPGVYQTISKTGLTETFNHVTQTSGANIVLQLRGPIQINGNFTQSSGIFDVNPNGSFGLTVRGNVIINGTFRAQSGTFALASLSGAQSISGTGASFYNFTSDNTAGVSFQNGNWNIIDYIMPLNGTISNTGATITLLSNANQTARVPVLPASASSAFVGNFTVQRYISARDSGYHIMSSPVSGLTVNNWDQQLLLYGIGGIHGQQPNNPSFASVRSTGLSPFLSPSNVNDPISNCLGYEVYCADASGTAFSAHTLTYTGQLNSGDQSIGGRSVAPLSSSGGSGNNVTQVPASMIGNPFASFIRWSLISADNPGASTCYILDETDHYSPHTAANDIDIPAGDGFLVNYSFASTPFHIRETSKVNSNLSTFLRPVHVADLKLKLSAPSISKWYHEINLNFDAAASLGYDNGLDAELIHSPNPVAPSLAFITANKELVNNTFNPAAAEAIDMPVKIFIGKDEKYTIESFGASRMAEYTCVVLEDRQQHKLIDLKDESAYTFDARMTDSPDRFVLHLSRKNAVCANIRNKTMSDNQIQISTANSTAVIQFDLDEASRANISVFNVSGQKVMSDLIVDAFKETLTIDLSGNPSGIYLISINLGNQNISRKVLVNNSN